MNKYIFLSNEGATYQPNSNSIDADCENAQVIGFANGDNEKEAFDNLLKENEDIKNTNFNEVYCYKITDNNPKYFCIKE